MPTGRELDTVALAEGNPNKGVDGSLPADSLRQAAQDITGRTSLALLRWGVKKGRPAALQSQWGFTSVRGYPLYQRKLLPK